MQVNSHSSPLFPATGHLLFLFTYTSRELWLLCRVYFQKRNKTTLNGNPFVKRLLPKLPFLVIKDFFLCNLDDIVLMNVIKKVFKVWFKNEEIEAVMGRIINPLGFYWLWILFIVERKRMLIGCQMLYGRVPNIVPSGIKYNFINLRPH